MQVADLRQFLSATAALFRTGKKSADDLEAVISALEPFADLSPRQFAQLLSTKVPSEDRPPSQPRKATGQPTQERSDKLRAATDRIVGLYERATDPSLDYGEIEREVNGLTDYTKLELLQIAGAIGIRAKGTKTELLNKIRLLIEQRKDMFRRTAAQLAQ